VINMAGRQRPDRKPADQPAAAPAGLSFSPQPGEVRKSAHGRESKPNPFAGACAYALEHGATAQAVSNGQEAREVTNALRRDKADDMRLTVQYQDADGNAVRVEKGADDKLVYPDSIRSVHFGVKAGRQDRKYNTDDIRAWHLATNGVEITGKVPPEVREAFKIANGFAKNPNSDETAAQSAA
jgi:hypothetical protein